MNQQQQQQPTVLVTGAGGDLGFECVKSLLNMKTNYKVRAAVSVLNNAKMPQLKELNCEIIQLDKSNLESVKEACKVKLVSH